MSLKETLTNAKVLAEQAEKLAAQNALNKPTTDDSEKIPSESLSTELTEVLQTVVKMKEIPGFLAEALITLVADKKLVPCKGTTFFIPENQVQLDYLQHCEKNGMVQETLMAVEVDDEGMPILASGAHVSTFRA